ncbi:MAG: hypothetical protein MK105_05385 [Crocinitomicaceae bacterium]|nr:hypothetical protein [Crocinitomicaceae bacterium]
MQTILGSFDPLQINQQGDYKISTISRVIQEIFVEIIVFALLNQFETSDYSRFVAFLTRIADRALI